MATTWDRFPASTRWINADNSFVGVLRQSGLDRVEALSARSRGEVVTDHRSSWVRRFRIGDGDFHVKTYDYPTCRDLLRGVGRTTLAAASRPVRERDALIWLRDHGFGGPTVLAIVEVRVCAILRRAVLVTETWPGRPADSLLRELGAAEAQRLVQAIEALVGRLHAAGFRDRNLDLRNLLARPNDVSWEVVKIDSPRFRIVPSGRHESRFAAEDRARLRRSLDALGLGPLAPSIRDHAG